MSNTTANQSPLIKAQVFSEFMLEQLHAGFLPENLHRNVGDFNDGDTIYVPVLGETVIRDYTEDTGVPMDPVDSGQVSLTITEYVSAGSYVTDKLKDDAYKAAQLEASIPREHLRLIKERWETDLLAQVNSQTAADPNTINGVSHRWVADNGTTVGVLSLEDFLYAKLALDEANAPEEGRLFIVPPIAEASINRAIAGQAYNLNPQFTGIYESGIGKSMRFLRNMFGFDVYISTRVPYKTTSEAITGGPEGNNTLATSRVCVAGCFANDMTTPFMGALRRPPSTEGFRNTTFKRDEYTSTARWGFGVQRFDTLLGVLVSPTVYK